MKQWIILQNSMTSQIYFSLDILKMSWDTVPGIANISFITTCIIFGPVHNAN